MSTISAFYPGDDMMLGAAAVIAAIFLLTAVSLSVALLLPRRPTTRHTLLLSALICSLATPLLAVAVRGWDIATLVWHVAPAEPPAFVPIVAQPAYPTTAAARPAYQAGSMPVHPHGSMPVLGPPPSNMPVMPAPPIDAAIVAGDDPGDWLSAPPPRGLPAESFDAQSAQPDHAARPPAPATPKPRAYRGWLVLALGGWIAISAVLLARVASSGIRLVRLRRCCQTTTGDVPESVLAAVRRTMGNHKLPPILTCPRAESPFAAGVFRPAVILPVGLAGKLSTDELCDVLTHESAHALRRDPAVRYLQAIATGLFWPLPTIHLVNRQLAQAREEICDNYVLAQREPVAYAETLLKVAALVGRGEPTLSAVGILPRRGKLEARIAGLIAQRRSRATRSSRLGAAICLASLLVASTIACGTTVVETEAEPPAAAPPLQAREGADERQRMISSLEGKQKKIKQLQERFDRLMGDGRYLLAEAPPAAEAPPDKPSAEETAAEKVFQLLSEGFKTGQLSGPEEQYVWSRRWMDAQTARNPAPAARLEAAQAHAARMTELRAVAEQLVAGGQGSKAQVAMANFYLAEAERMVAAAKATRHEKMVNNDRVYERSVTPQGATQWREVEQAAGQGAAEGEQAPETRTHIHADALHLQTGNVQLDVGPEETPQPAPAEPNGAEPDSGESAELKIPTPDELLAIERRVIADRQKLHSGRVALATYAPEIQKEGGRRLRFTGRSMLYFDGEKTRADEIGRAETWYKISTPTSFVKWGVSVPGAPNLPMQDELLFEPTSPPPHASEVADARLLGLALTPAETLGQQALEDVFPRQERTNLKIEAGSDEAAGPVLKVCYDYANKQGHPVSVEYWLAPRLGYLPVYYSSSWPWRAVVDSIVVHSTLRSKYARYHTAHEGNVWFPSEVECHVEPDSLGAPNQVARVEGAEFNLVLPPLTFDRRGVEQAAATNGRRVAGGTRLVPPQTTKTAPPAGQPTYLYAPQPAVTPTAAAPNYAPPPLGVPAGPADGLTPCLAVAEPPPTGAQPPPVPTADELQKIEERILENRRSIRSGRLEVDQYTIPGNDPRVLQVVGHDLYDFKGNNVTEEHGLGWKKKTYLVRTPTRLARVAADGEVTEQVFEGGQQAPPADLESRFMGFSSVGPSLADWLAKPDRRNQKIVAAVENGEPVLKVSFQLVDERSVAAADEVEYWLAPRCDYLPVFTRRTRPAVDDGAMRDSAVVKLARYQPVGIWFPTEIVTLPELRLDGQWKQMRSPNVQRVKKASFAIGPYIPGSEEAEEPEISPPTAPPQSIPPLPQSAPRPAEKIGAIAIPTPDELLAIEKKFLDERRALPSGSVVGMLYKPADDKTEDTRLGPSTLRSIYPDDLELIGRYTLAFDGRKRRVEWLADRQLVTLITTPTSFIRWSDGKKNVEEKFARQNPAPRAGEVPDPLALGLLVEPIDSLGQLPLDACFSHRQRQNLKIVWAEEDREQVLKVSYTFADESLGLVEMEYWLSSSRDNFPIYLAEKWQTAEGAKGHMIRVGLYGWGGASYPLSIKRYTLEGDKWRMVDLLHVQSAWFHQLQDPFLFTRQSVAAYGEPIPIPATNSGPAPLAPLPAASPPAAEPKAPSGAARPSKATPGVGLLDPEGVSRLRISRASPRDP